MNAQCGWTPLGEAANKGQKEMVTLLLDEGARINQANQVRRRMMMTATTMEGVGTHVDASRAVRHHAAALVDFQRSQQH